MVKGCVKTRPRAERSYNSTLGFPFLIIMLASVEKYSSTTRVSASPYSVALSSGPIVVTHKKVIIMKKNSSEGHKEERDHFPCVMSPLTAHSAGHSIRHLRAARFLPRRNMIQILPSRKEPRSEVGFPDGVIIPYYVHIH